MSERQRLRLTVNGTVYEREVEPRLLLVDLLRDELGLTGTHVGCEHGVCGACTVLLDGRAVNACLVLALQVQDREVLTIEGLAAGDKLHPLQQAFIEHGAIQCGFCSPGMILTAVELLGRNPTPTETDVRVAISGNLCRCTGYQKIVEAVLSAAQTVAGKEGA